MKGETVSDLKPCPNPWCNSRKSKDPEIRAAEAPILMPSRGSAEWCVACPVCPLQSPWRDTEAEAVEEWNQRPLETQLAEAREAAAPFVDLTHMRGEGVKVISKTLDDLTPIHLSVTKAQMLRACRAFLKDGRT